MYTHVLAIGCTGMLFDASVVLSRQCRALTSVARTEASLTRLDAAIAGAGCAHHTLALDWSRPDAFIDTVADHVRVVGTPQLVLAWLHDDALGPHLAQAIAPCNERCAFFQVRGSTAAKPAGSASSFLDGHDIPANLAYHQIILGFHADHSRPRWLRNDEICAGVLEAIAHPRPVSIVGTVMPWTNHP